MVRSIRIVMAMVAATLNRFAYASSDNLRHTGRRLVDGLDDYFGVRNLSDTRSLLQNQFRHQSA